MHPALSIILFSTLSGAGFGLGAVIGIAGFPDGSPVIEAFPLFAPVFVSAGLASLGLVCSVFHLRRPSRAWRAFSQWRSSWLSREGILAVAALITLALLAFASPVDSAYAVALGFAALLLCALSVFATSMIYTQIRAVPAWHTSLTPLLYLAFASAGGLLAASALASGFSGIARLRGIYQPAAQLSVFDGLAVAAALAILAAWIIQTLWWRRLGRTGTGNSTPETATRLESLGQVRLLEPPHTGSSYLTDEMGFVIGRRHASKLRSLALLFGGLIPIACLALTQMSVFSAGVDFAMSLLALILHLFGVGLSRWLFFAEARHTVTLYY